MISLLLDDTGYKGKKKPWLALPLVIRAYILENFKQVEAEDEALKGNHFVNLNYRMYNLEKFMVVHCKKEKFSWSYSHARKYHEEVVKY